MSKTKFVFIRPQGLMLASRLREPRKCIQAVAGPRQVGKTTMVQQVADELRAPSHFASADGPTLRDIAWVYQQWETARLLVRNAEKKEAILILDEVQKISNWSEAVKQLWDEDTREGLNLKVVLLGSAPLLIQKGITESLMGRFEILYVPHWSFLEMKEAFNSTVDEYIFFGAYPGAHHLVDNQERWLAYILDSIIEPTISKDVLLLSRIDKPILLRRLLELSCVYSGQLVSLTKILGQLHDAGNVTTLAHYLELLSGAGMVCGIQKYTATQLRSRKSIPKFQVFNAALMSSQGGVAFEQAKTDPTYWGRLTESAIGTHLVNAAMSRKCELFYWRERNREVDFVIRSGNSVVAIEVSTQGKNKNMRGMDAFITTFNPKRVLLVGTGGISIAEFLSTPVHSWLR